MNTAEQNAIRITAEDLTTGESGSIDIMDDYVITTAGSCYVAQTQTHANGTHVVTIKGRKP